MKKLLLHSFLACVIVVCSATTASARTYIVEMITFTNEGVTPERWDHGSTLSTTRRNKVNSVFAKAENLNSGGNLAYLGSVHSALSSSNEHRILKVARWTQETANYARSPLVNISNADLSIKGGVRVYAPNLLFAELNLMYAPNGNSLAVTATSGREAYFIDERRRMKLKETHYFDHSKFGAVLIVVPL